MSEMIVRIEVQGGGVKGDLALVVPPGTKARARDRMLDRALAPALAEAAQKLDAVLVAAPSSYAFVQPGKDPEGRTRFVVSAAVEGERLVPARP